MSVKENTSWQNIPITAGGGKKDLICFEELIDYELMQDDLKPTKPVTLSTLSKKVQKKKKRLMEIQAKKHSLEEDVGQFDAAKKKKRVATTSDEHDILVAKKQMKRKKNKQKKKLSETLPVEENLNSEEEIDCDIDMSDWDELMIPEEILKALREMSFTKPTLIQKQVIPKAIGEKSDILAAAETGSGKTLAFGIPLLHHMIEDRARGLLDAAVESDEEFEFEEDNTVLKNTEEEEGEEEDNIVNVSHDSVQEKKILPALILTPTRELAVQVKNHLVKVARHTGFKMVTVIGGMSAPKQERLLKKNPDIVVATPGRLWEFVEQGHPYLLNLHRIRYLVIDEADRMLERGHFEELEKILKIINRKSKVQTKRQTYMFSATLTTVHDAPNRARMRGKTITKAVKLETLMGKIGIRENRHVIDITTRKGTAEKLYEAKIICNSKEKDHYLYYFLKCHPGRTLVFTNSIDCIFHLVSVLDALLLTPLHLHSKMQQRQRLKHLDRFHSRPNSVLIASDVAARGLDIPNVQHVVHYQIPRTCETYIHRSGRSARTGKEGLSVMLISPEELPVYKRLCNSLKLEEQMPQFPVDEDSIRAIKRIVNLAKEIDSLNHKTKKVRINNDWFSKAAAEMEIELDDDVMMRDDHIYETKQLLHEKQREMKSLLQQPVIPKHFSGKYLTRTGKLSLPGVEQSNAIQKLKKAKKGGSISMPSSQLSTSILSATGNRNWKAFSQQIVACAVYARITE